MVRFVNVSSELKCSGGSQTTTLPKTRWCGFALPTSEKDWPSTIRRTVNLSSGKLRFRQDRTKRSSTSQRFPCRRLPVAVSSTQPQARVLPSTESANPVSIARLRKHSRLKLAAVLGACLAIAFAAIMLLRNSPPRVVSSFDLFWGPVLSSSRPVVVCTGSNRVYVLSREAHSRYRTNHPSPDDATPNLETLVPREDLRKFTGEDFLPVKDTYLTIGDASATAQISSLLTSRRHPYDLRFGSDLSFGDLREGSAILIGAFNNNWTLNMTDSLRFVFEAGDTAEMHVQDRFDPKRSWWPKFSGAKFSEDYAIVSRVLD